jgi:hypothetical protein
LPYGLSFLGAAALTVVLVGVLVAAVVFAQFPSQTDVFFFLFLELFAFLGIAGRQLKGFLGLDAGLQLAAAFHFGVELGAEQQGHVQDPQPQQHDDDAADGAVGFVVVAVITGVFFITTDEADNITFKARGRNLLGRSDGLFLTSGNVSFTFDKFGNVIVEFDTEGPGNIIDVCKVLS